MEKELNNQQKIFSQRFVIIALILLIVVSVTGVVIFRMSYKQNERVIADQCEQFSSTQRDNIIKVLESQLQQVETAAANFRAAIFNNGLNISHDSVEIFNAFERMLDVNPQMSGAVAGFEDGVIPEYDNEFGFIPLVRRTDSCYLRMQVGAMRDARHTLEWYSWHKLNQKEQGLWSEPFLSDDGKPITSYSLPLFDAKHKFIGVIAVDLNLADLATSVDQMKPYPSSSMTIIDNQLRFIAHPNRDYILKWTLPEAMKRIGINPSAYPLHHVGDRISGHLSVMMGHQPTFIFYGPLEQTRWMILLYIPHSVVYDQLSSLRQEMLIVAGIGFSLALIATIFLIWIMLKQPRNNNRRRRYDDEEYDDDAFMK